MKPPKLLLYSTYQPPKTTTPNTDGYQMLGGDAAMRVIYRSCFT